MNTRTAREYTSQQLMIMTELALAVVEADRENGNLEGLKSMCAQFLLTARAHELDRSAIADLLDTAYAELKWPRHDEKFSRFMPNGT